MASGRIKGITIEIDGDTTKLTTALKQVDKQIRDTQSSLRDVNKLLKMDPGNADLLAQKQKYLTDAIDATKKKLEEEKSALEQLKNGPQTDDTIRQQEALTREIAAAEKSDERISELRFCRGTGITDCRKEDAGCRRQNLRSRDKDASYYGRCHGSRCSGCKDCG